MTYYVYIYYLSLYMYIYICVYKVINTKYVYSVQYMYSPTQLSSVKLVPQGCAIAASSGKDDGCEQKPYAESSLGEGFKPNLACRQCPKLSEHQQSAVWSAVR